MLDEETGAEPRVLSASIADLYLLLLREDSSILLASMDSSNYELEEVEKADKVLSSNKWVAGCLYTDSRGTFRQEGDSTEKSTPQVFMFLLSSTGALHVCSYHPHSPAFETNMSTGLQRFRPLQACLCD